MAQPNVESRLPSLNDELTSLRQQFEAGASRWPKLECYLLSWPEAEPEPKLPDYWRKCAVPVGPETSTTLHYKALYVGSVWRDSPQHRYRTGFRSALVVTRDFGRLFGDFRDHGDAEEADACGSQFKDLAERTASCLERLSNLSSDTMSWQGHTRWLLALFELIELPSDRIGNATRWRSSNAFLDSSRAVSLAALPQHRDEPGPLDMDKPRLRNTGGDRNSTSVIDFESLVGDALVVPGVFARHSEKLGDSTVRLVWFTYLCTCNESLAHRKFTPQALCIALREALRVFDALQKDTVNTLALMAGTRFKSLHDLNRSPAPESVNELVSQCNDSEGGRTELLARVLDVQSWFAASDLRSDFPYIAEFRELLEEKKDVGHRDVFAWLVAEKWAATVRGIIEYGGQGSQQSKDNLGALDVVMSAIRHLVREGVDVWIAPRLDTTAGAWTSGLCKTLREFKQSLVYFDFYLSCDSLGSFDESTFIELLRATEGYLETLKDIDFSSVPNVPPNAAAEANAVAENVSADYRAGGTPNGEPLSSRFISDVFQIDKSTIIRNLTNRIVDPRRRNAHLYSWKSVVIYFSSKEQDAITILQEWQRSNK